MGVTNKYKDYTTAELHGERCELVLDLNKVYDESTYIENELDEFENSIDDVWNIGFDDVISDKKTKIFIDLNDMNAKREFRSLMLRDPYYKDLKVMKQNLLDEMEEINKSLDIVERFLKIL